MIRCLECQNEMDDFIGSKCPICGWVYTQAIKNKFEAFNLAKNEYEKIVQRVEDLCSRGNLNFDGMKLMLKTVDYGIQTVLYLMAVGDSKVEFDEIDFIKNIVRNGDIFVDNIIDVKILELNSKLTWDIMELPTFNKPIQNQTFEFMVKYVLPLISGFAKVCTTIDKTTATTKSSMYELEEKIIHIVTILMDAAWNTKDAVVDYRNIVSAAELAVTVVFSNFRREAENNF